MNFKSYFENLYQTTIEKICDFKHHYETHRIDGVDFSFFVDLFGRFWIYRQEKVGNAVYYGSNVEEAMEYYYDCYDNSIGTQGKFRNQRVKLNIWMSEAYYLCEIRETAAGIHRFFINHYGDMKVTLNDFIMYRSKKSFEFLHPMTTDSVGVTERETGKRMEFYSVNHASTTPFHNVKLISLTM